MSVTSQPQVLLRPPILDERSLDLPWQEASDFDPDGDIAGQLEQRFPGVPGAGGYDAFLRTKSGSLRPVTLAVEIDGAVLSLEPHKPARATVMDIIRGHEEGFSRGDPSAVYLQAGPMGRGNGYVDWNSLLSLATDESARLLFDAACLAILAKTGGVIDGLRFGRERAVAEVWVKRQGIDSPMVLRGVIDRKKCWRPRKLARRLRITKKFAKNLLTSVGYAQAYPGAPWCRSDEPQALRRRAKWIENEHPRYNVLKSDRRRRKRKRTG